MRIAYCILFVLLCFVRVSLAQEAISGKIVSEGMPVPFAAVVVLETDKGALSDSDGFFQITGLMPGSYKLRVSALNYISVTKDLTLAPGEVLKTRIGLMPEQGSLNEVVVTGTMKEMSRLNSPIPVEVYTQKFFQKNPTPSLFEAVGMINGVRPQLNCNVCNTGDIHINGMEGPYTMVLIDGMPIVSALSTVYGLNGIPSSIVQRIEVVKGPAASLYGSEAMGGIINIITKDPADAPLLGIDVFGTSWQEYNADVSLSVRMGKTRSLFGVNYYNYRNALDKNKDGFTDVTLQDRLSVFNKWSLDRKESRAASISLRYVQEDRWGGQMEWNKAWRGSDSIYGESIATKRVELIGLYQLPLKEKIMAQFSYNMHHQDSYYGTIAYLAKQQVGFAQVYWDKELGKRHNLLAGTSLRYTVYDDNTPATEVREGVVTRNRAAITPLPGLFVQDEWTLNKTHTFLAGYRYDYDLNHGHIHSPRLAWKWAANPNHTLRTSFGTGFRVVNLFTEDHAALTGARKVEITEELNPERTYNANLNYVWRIPADGYFIGIDATAFYSYFTNKILGDFLTHPDKIIYKNLDGHAISRGVSLNTEANFSFPLRLSLGITWQDVYLMDETTAGAIKTGQLHAPHWTGNYVCTYTFPKHNLSIDFTGQWNGPMRLPVQPNDFRPEYSPWFTLANIQATKKLKKGWEIYGGLKNIFNFVPENPLMRPFDPFDKTAADPVNNPQGYTFDTEYNYAPIQGIRLFAGFRYNMFR